MRKLLLFAATLVFAASVHAAEVPNITIDDLKTAMTTQKVVLLDANGSESFQSGHIPGAIDFVSAKEKLSSVMPDDKQVLVVAYCANPQCPAYRAAAAAAKKLGYKNIKHLSAGIQGWKDGGEKMEPGPTNAKS